MQALIYRVEHGTVAAQNNHMIFFIFFYGSYLIFPLLLAGIILIAKGRSAAWLLVILSGLIIWLRFVEPNMITIEEHAIQQGFEGRYALISDPHLGLYKGEDFLERVVAIVNEQNVDALFIAGDLLYKPDVTSLEELFSPLEKSTVPVYVIVGNHDAGVPGDDLRTELTEVFEKNSATLLNNEVVQLDMNTKIVGLGSLWKDDADVSLLNSVSDEENIIVLAHNPDVVATYPNSFADITLSGHTHGGQIRIPYLYKSRIPTEGDFDKGLYVVKGNKVFITTGVGEVGLPMRLNNPPVIDIITLY